MLTFLETFPLEARLRKVFPLYFVTKTKQQNVACTAGLGAEIWITDLQESDGIQRTRPRHSMVFIIYWHLILVQNTFTHACCQRRNERSWRELVHFLHDASLETLHIVDDMSPGFIDRTSYHCLQEALIPSSTAPQPSTLPSAGSTAPKRENIKKWWKWVAWGWGFSAHENRS